MVSMYRTQLSPAALEVTVSQQKLATLAALGWGTSSGLEPRTIEMTECWAAFLIFGLE